MADVAKSDITLTRKVSFSEQPPDVVYESDDDVELLGNCGCRVDGIKSKMPHGEACFYCAYVDVWRAAGAVWGSMLGR